MLSMENDFIWNFGACATHQGKETPGPILFTTIPFIIFSIYIG